MSSYEKLVFAGNLGKNPDSRFTPGGSQVTAFPVACNRKWSKDGQEQEETIWYKVSAWGRLAEVTSEYLSKGSQVLVEGRLQIDKETGGPKIWTRQDGTPGASFEVTAQRVVFLGGKKRQEQQKETEQEIPF